MAISNKLKYLLISIPIAIYLVYFFTLWQDIPVIDDYWYLNDFTVFREKVSLLKKLDPLFITRNSHRCVPSYIFGYLQMIIFDEIRPKYMLFIGFLSLLGIIGILAKTLKEIGIIYVIPLLLLGLNPTSFSLTFFPLVSLQVYFTFFLIFVLVYILVYKPKIPFIVSLLLGVAVTFSNGNGMLIWPSGFLILLLSDNYTRKKTALWCIVGSAAIILYFTNMQNEGIRGNTTFNLMSIPKLIAFVLTFLGNAFDFAPSIKLSNINQLSLSLKILFSIRLILVLLLPISFSIFLFSVLRKQIKSRLAINNKVLLFIIGIFAYVLLSALVGGVFRSGEGFGMGLSYRYKFYGQIVVLLFYVLLVNFYKKKQFIFILSIIYWLLSYFIFYPYAKNFNNELITSNLNINNSEKTYIHTSFGETINNDINGRLIPNILGYTIFDFQKKNTVASLKLITQKANVPFKINCKATLNENDLNIDGLENNLNEKVIVLKNEATEKITFIPAYIKPFIDWDNFKLNQGIYSPIFIDGLKDGNYALLISDIYGLKVSRTDYFIEKSKTSIKIFHN